MSKGNEKECEGEEMFEFNQQDKDQPQIGTEILDPSLPSDLNFESGKKKDLEGGQIDSDSKYVKGKSNITGAEDIQSYSIKGKIEFNREPKYKPASIVHDHVDTFEVKMFDEEKSRGWKSIWESIVGYTKRQICIEEGFIYIFENTKEGYTTQGVYNLSHLFKVFSDPEELKIRLVFRNPVQDHLNNKNMKVKNCQEIIEKLCEQISKVGLTVVSEN